MKRALIVGSEGQDGRLLHELLASRGYEIVGIGEGVTHCSGAYRCGAVDIRRTEEVFDLIGDFRPDEVYYLAAFHHSSEDVPEENINLFHESYEVHVSALVNFLEAMRKYSPETRLFYAASSLIFGEVRTEPQDEDTPFNPRCVYGITKTAGLFSCRFYRDRYSVFASVGILYNHESVYRADKFVSKKIVKGAVNIKKGKQDRIVLGALNAEVDWGYAPDYVDAFWRILNAERPDDFIVATGQKHSVSHFAEITFGHMGMDWRDYVDENRNVINREGAALVGDPAKLMHITGWRPTVDFEGMIELLLRAEGAELDG